MNPFTIQTRSRTDFINIDNLVTEAAEESGLTDGIVTVFVPHTTAGITINENADPDVLDRMVPWSGDYSAIRLKSEAYPVFPEGIRMETGRLESIRSALQDPDWKKRRLFA